MSALGSRTAARFRPVAARVAGLAAGLALLGALAPSAARAGSYDVYACGGPAGGAQNSFTAEVGPQMSAYSICPPQSAVGTGIATKVTSNGGIAPNLSGAYQIFEAPPGASLEYVDFNVGAIRLADQWSVGVVAYGGDFNAGIYPYGCYAHQPGCGVGTSVFSIRVRVPLYNQARFRFQTRCENPTGCDASASPFSPANRALFSAANVVVRVDDWSPPTFIPRRGSLLANGWHRGSEEEWTGYFDNVGIMISRLYVDGAMSQQQDYRDGSWPGWLRCDFTRRRPCVDVDPGGLSLDTTSLSDGEHAVRIEAVDAAGNVNGIDHTIQVDNTTPAKAGSLDVEGGEGWHARNDFTVRWANPPGQVSPIVRAHYALCPDGRPDACSRGSVDGEAIDGLTKLAVPGPGEYAFRVWLEDAAGNVDPEHASDPVRLRFDDEPPAAVFEQSDPARPTAIEASVDDRGSGVATGDIELRPVGGRDWRDLRASLHGDRLVAQLDDVALPDGLYELRARVRDRAGNERTGDRRRDGSRMEVRLPVRMASRVTLAVERRCRGRGARKRCRRPSEGSGVVVRRRGRTRVAGVVETGAREPIAHAALSVTEAGRGPFQRPRTVGTVRSDAIGRFTLSLGRGSSRTVRFHYGGTPVVKPASAELVLLVPARSTIAADRRSLRNGQAVTFAGRLEGGDVPPGGKLLDLQAHYRGRWRTFATPRTDARGRWRYRYRFGATSGTVRYRFRARIRREAAYPYELGYSRVVRVTVRG